MSSEPDTALKRLYEAVLALASEEGKIEQRLALAYFDSLQTIPATALPASVQGEWRSILSELSNLYPDRNAERRADPLHAVDLAQRILLVYDSMIR